MLHAIIMAGGSGTRFWPESREQRPKQLLNLAGERSMLQATLDRLTDLVPHQRVLIATSRLLAGPIAEQLPELSTSAILAEPCRRDTAPCIGLAALAVTQHDSDATLVVLPADHVISPDAEFRRAIRAAADLVDAQPARIATFGIRPSYPAEIFGYIERGEAVAAGEGSPPVYRAAKFREKPKADVAKEYVASGKFYWNSGIFVWKAATILQALGTHQPDMLARLKKIAAAFGRADYDQVLDTEFAAIKGVSIDYAVMEHATDVVVIEAPFTWDDVGSWQALARLRGQDADGNTVVHASPSGRYLSVDTTGTIVRTSGDHLIVTLGLRDCLIVHTPDATLVANKHDEESIRKVVQLLRDNGWTELL